MRKYILLTIALPFTLSGCNDIENTARKPISENRSKFIAQSIERSIDIADEENKLFEEYINNHSEKHFRRNKANFWYSYNTRNVKDSITPTLSDSLVYTYSILNLQNETIYDKNNIGLKQYILDKQDILPILRHSLKIMKKGESIKVLSPSILAYGYLGDNNKIIKNQPLIFNIELIELVKNNK